MLSGRYPSDDFAELRPRVTWDRIARRLEARAGRHRLAVTNGGTIPDRGLYGVFIAPGDEAARRGRRVGELDEEMVFELREGEVFLLGASSWRAEQITHDRVLVSPAAGQPGKMPFWHGDRPGRARAFGVRIGELVRTRRARSRADAARRSRETTRSTPRPPRSLVAYVRAQVEATGEVPSDRAIVVERFVDELGDWRVVVLLPVRHARASRRGRSPSPRAFASDYVDVDLHYTDDGMAFRIPACDEPPPRGAASSPRPTRSRPMVTARARRHGALRRALPRVRGARAAPAAARPAPAHAALGAAQARRRPPRRRVAAPRASRSSSRRTASACATCSTCPGLVELLRDVAARRVRVTTVDTRTPSPFASSVLFAFVANFIYDGDAPLAERRAQALAIDIDRLRELLGEAELRELLDPERHRGARAHAPAPDAPRDARRRRARSAPLARRPVARRARRAASRRRRAPRPGSSELAAGPAHRPGARRRRAALRRRRGRGEAARRAGHGAPAGPARRAPRAGGATGARSRRPLRADARAVRRA